MKKRPLLAASGLFVLALTSVVYLFPAAPPFPAIAAPAPAAQAGAELSPQRYLADVTYLASDALKGRGNGTPELEQAGDYIANEFRKAGLKPAGEDGTYFQKFEVTTGADFGPKNELRIGANVLKRDTDFVPMMISNTAEADAPLVFVGYSITAPEYKYDDYAGIDVTGKIVVAFRYEPQEKDAKSVFAGTDITRHAAFVNKAINARQHGAKGIIFISDPVNHRDEEVGPATRRLEYTDLGIPAVHAKRATVEAAFRAAGKDLAQLHDAIDKDLKPQSFELPGGNAHIASEVIRSRKTVKNVIGALEGSDPALKNQWVVVGAHYDHLGLGDRNSLAPSQVGQIHHGADDNASGSAGVMELARYAANDTHKMKRSVLFMTFAGEEIGLLGSNWFVNHPTIPIASIDGMLNLDMIGRLNNDKLFVGGIGTSPTYKTMIEEFNKNGGLSVSEPIKAMGLNLEYSESGYGASDHTSFNAKKIPVLFFFSGLHTDYHKPSDTADKINAPGAVKVLSLTYLLMDKIADDQQKLSYSEVAPPQAPGRGGGGGYGPYFGSVPDFRDDIEGVLFSDVVNNSPAAKAGLKAGDLMVEFDGKPVKTLNDYAYALRQKQPGDVIQVVVKRNGEAMKVTVTLEARR